MIRHALVALPLALALAASPAPGQVPQEIPAHPDELTFEPIVFRKRIDKSSPLLARSLCENEVVEGTFKFFRPNPAGDGTTEHFLTIEFGEGRLGSLRRVSPDVIDPASALEPATEEVGIVFHHITWTYEPTGASHYTSWREGQ